MLGTCKVGIRRRLSFIPYRIRHGFWPDELWSLDCTIARFAAPRVRAFAGSGGCPHAYVELYGNEQCHKEWEADVLKMADALDAVAEDVWAMSKPEVEEGMALFSEFFGHLWN